MMNTQLKEAVVRRILPGVQTPGRYVGGELHAVTKDHRQVRGKLCFASPDTYAIGMSNHGMQVLYQAVNRLPDWVCERVFAPWRDMEEALRREGLPLYSLESFTPLDAFDVVGFTLQYELCYTNVLTILDLGRIPLRSRDREEGDPLVMAGGPCAQNPEPLSEFIDVFVIGDGEETLPAICRRWLELRSRGGGREEWLHAIAREFPFAYVPRCYRVEISPDGVPVRVPRDDAIPKVIAPAVLADLEAYPVVTRPIVPNVEVVQDRIAIEIMRGCPWRCRFCQSTTIKRPLRYRRAETIVEAAWEAYQNTGMNEISLLSLSSSDHPQFDLLIRRLRETFVPHGVAISVPSLRVNEQLRTLTELLTSERHSGLTMAPEAALDDMRRQINKRIRNEDLLEGCRQAFRQGFSRVKLYFMCGLPGEREADLAGIIELAEEISRIGREVRGKPAAVTAGVSNFVPKPHTPYQWQAIRTREYFQAAHRFLRTRHRMRSVQVKCHPVESSLLEGVMARGDHRLANAVERAWRQGCRFDGWGDQLDSETWWRVIRETGVDVHEILHRERDIASFLPWDHIGIRQGRGYLEREQQRAAAEAVSLLNGT
ncbi:MAG: TIGR03960 family B12-binding radical SAM protein [Thermogutta sp.]|nr:TIGR03960 family B12-binding radical SAM protein [Thermogutta sp.]